MKNLILASVLILSACAGTPQSVPQASYEVTASYVTALKAANTYAAMPRCSITVAPPCSNQTTVNRIADASNTAHIAVLASQAVAKDTTASATDAQKATLAANDAIAALNKMIPARN